MHVSRICSDLVKIKSENPPNRTEDVIAYIRDFLDGIGIRSSISGNGQGMDNLVALQKNAPLMFCGHVDVVPALADGWSRPPFSGAIEDGYVWGRGATDMKGGCAAILAACQDRADRDCGIPATLAFVCDEETGGINGIRYLLSHNALPPCDCIIAEPTPVRHPNIGQKGLCRVSLAFEGVPAHGSLYPAVGVSAIMETMPFLSYMNELHNTEYPVDETLREIIDSSSGVLEKEFGMSGAGNILKRMTFNPGVISGGEKSNVVAQHCDLELEMRIPWGCSISDLLAGIAAHAPHATMTTHESFTPSITDPASPLVSITCREVERVYGGTVAPIVQWAASDARHLRMQGFSVIEYGPGEMSCLHAVNERTSVDSLEKATAIYSGIMQHYAGNKRQVS
ncbi:M20/M25/M40 family metallo-hydrolase [Methanoregula sp.]|uniref:M20/M25/M40 family metallo-hydrolase n=1 Tax=Methanoregula sp. TaxID=2052170 RepID=UPI00236FC9B5|nr:M20/M25/M40 family metallo-hydrolase [Methanoregula sp.]MDD1685907.1 M20/M25/M40 family metallo-hydrolase [Methanoregula sp.]